MRKVLPDPRRIAKLSQYLPQMPELWLCQDKARLAGFCGNNGGYVEMLLVHPDHMRKGICTRLLDHVRRLHDPLALAVNEANHDALAFYLRCGVRVMSRSETDNQGRPYPLLHLAQALS